MKRIKLILIVTILSAGNLSSANKKVSESVNFKVIAKMDIVKSKKAKNLTYAIGSSINKLNKSEIKIDSSNVSIDFLNDNLKLNAL